MLRNTTSMSNIIRLKLSKIKYTGDSIGDDIRVSGKVFEKQFVLDEQIRRGESVFLDTEIGKIEIDQDIYTFQITLQVTEKDLVFDDVGRVTKAVTVNLNTTKSQ
ncbi:hypothetical protein HY224_01940 [Candidatus Uhrbacteria bacterium]|nr:hypothetical protein [Candidatus Uhrbacteria bacterium]